MTSSAMAATAQQHQWSEEETREFIRIRADLERDLTAVSTGEGAAVKKKTLWDMASARMRERGFWRTAYQCKCKWKNLLSRYKVRPVSIPYSFEDFFFFNQSVLRYVSFKWAPLNLDCSCFDILILMDFDWVQFCHLWLQILKAKSEKGSKMLIMSRNMRTRK